MGPITASTSVDAPRERVFEFLADLANRPAFTDHFMRDFRLELLESSGVGAAARFRVEAPLNTIWMETVIDETDPPHMISERGQGGRLDRIPMFTAWEVVRGPGAVTTVSVAFWTEPDHPLDRIRERLGAGRWYRRRWSRALQRMRTLLEAERGSTERVGTAGGNRHPTGVR
jgi:uncharacterized protein YndB with AHSA1/START domain